MRRHARRPLRLQQGRHELSLLACWASSTNTTQLHSLAVAQLAQEVCHAASPAVGAGAGGARPLGLCRLGSCVHRAGGDLSVVDVRGEARGAGAVHLGAKRGGGRAGQQGAGGSAAWAWLHPTALPLFNLQSYIAAPSCGCPHLGSLLVKGAQAAAAHEILQQAVRARRPGVPLRPASGGQAAPAAA